MESPRGPDHRRNHHRKGTGNNNVRNTATLGNIGGLQPALRPVAPVTPVKPI